MHETQPPWLQAPADAVARWRNLTFGLFIHWDPSSLLGVEISWARQSRAGFGHGFIPDDVYDGLPASFHPAQFDARAIARIARDAGMRYLVFTAKHHAGFAMYETSLSDHNITRTPFGRDVLREIADATRSEGLAFGIYFSQPDWRHPAFVARDFAAFRPFVVGQLTELLTRYGPVDILFFDGLGCSPGDYDASNLFRTIRELQPSIIINDRCGLPGDYASPEQVVGAFRRDRPWESCITLGAQWSWKPQDALKSAHDCIRTLVSTVGGGGNLLLNVGPMPTGGVEPRQAAILQEVGDWLRRFGVAVYALEGGPYKPGGWGACTCHGNCIYLHILSWEEAPDAFPPLPARVLSAVALTGGDVGFSQDAGGLRFTLPAADRHPVDTILRLTLDRDATSIDPILVPTRSLARFQPVSASHAPGSAHALVDDDPSTEWSPGRQEPFWVEVDLGADRTFRRIDIREEGSPWEPRSGTFTISVRSDGDAAATWQTILAGDGIGNTFSRSFPAVSARYVRLHVHHAHGPVRISELQIYA